MAPPAPPPEESFLDTLLENPLIPAGAVALILLVGGLILFKVRRQRKSLEMDSSFVDNSRTNAPDSFFGSSGGRQIDTSEAAETGSSMVYSHSQLDAGGDVDPVAEADVYLAYGRDLQAEEILKEALKGNATRMAIHHKLLEIYAKRRDTKAFEGAAAEVRRLTQGQGPDWEQARDMGKRLDPGNPMFDAAPTAAVMTAAAGLAAAAPSASPPVPMPVAATSVPVAVRPPAAAPVPAPVARAPAVAPAAAPALDIDLDFDLGDPGAPPAAPASAASAKDAGLIEFDLGNLSLDLTPPSASAGAKPASPAGASGSAIDESDPLATKLALAQEFHALGDADAARSLVKEVVAEAKGALRTKAQGFLAELG